MVGLVVGVGVVVVIVGVFFFFFKAEEGIGMVRGSGGLGEVFRGRGGEVP